MNRNRVIFEDNISFKEFAKIDKKAVENPTVEGVISFDEIIKVFNNKKNIKSAEKRKLLAKEMFLEYLDVNFNVEDEDFL